LIVLSEATGAALTSGEFYRVTDVTAALTTLRFPTDHSLHPVINAHIGLGQFFGGRQSAGLALLRKSIAALLRQVGSGQPARIANVTLAAMTLVTQGPGKVVT